MTKPKTLDANDMRHMTGWELLTELGLTHRYTETNVPATFVTAQDPERTWTAWATMGRGRQARTMYVHFSAEFPVTLAHPDGTRERTSLTERVHFRGRADQEIEQFKEAR